MHDRHRSGGATRLRTLTLGLAAALALLASHLGGAAASDQDPELKLSEERLQELIVSVDRGDRKVLRLRGVRMYSNRAIGSRDFVDLVEVPAGATPSATADMWLEEDGDVLCSWDGLYGGRQALVDRIRASTDMAGALPFSNEIVRRAEEGPALRPGLFVARREVVESLAGRGLSASVASGKTSSSPLTVRLPGGVTATASVHSLTQHCMGESDHVVRVRDAQGRLLWRDDTGELAGSVRLACLDSDGDGVDDLVVTSMSHGKARTWVYEGGRR